MSTSRLAKMYEHHFFFFVVVEHFVFMPYSQDVARVKHYCKNNPLMKKGWFDPELEQNGVLVGLNAFGGKERIYAVNFYPDW